MPDGPCCSHFDHEVYFKVFIVPRGVRPGHVHASESSRSAVPYWTSVSIICPVQAAQQLQLLPVWSGV
jgi:hypothetical protein